MINDMRENAVKHKSFVFAVRAARLYPFLREQKKEFVLSKQLLGSGTSADAMAREAAHAGTKNDFRHKMGIAQKEINETIYWLELLKETDYPANDPFEGINNEASEIIKLITAIFKIGEKRHYPLPINL